MILLMALGFGCKKSPYKVDVHKASISNQKFTDRFIVVVQRGWLQQLKRYRNSPIVINTVWYLFFF